MIRVGGGKMKIEHLRCFYEIAQTGSISKASQNLYMAQPALSKIVKNLEQTICEKLFVRTPFGVDLTEQGELLQRYCQQILQLYDEYLQEKALLDKPDGIVSGVVELVISPLLLQTYYTVLMKKLSQRFPKIQFRFVEADLDAGEKIIANNMRALGLFLYDHNIALQLDTAVLAEEIYTTDIVFCMSVHSPYAVENEIGFQDISKEKMISTIFSKQSPVFPSGEYGLYTTNLDIVRQKLLSDDDIFVSVPRFIYEHKLISSQIICLPEKSHSLFSLYFIYNTNASQQNIYPLSFLKLLKEELLSCIFNVS